MATEPIRNDEAHEVYEAADTSLVQALTKAEIDQQITTAKQYPRSIARFIRQCEEVVTLNEDVAKECLYALPRGGKTIEGPSARLAEIVASSWGNCRAAARVIDDSGDFVTAQGVFHDLETNVAVSFEVRRRITNKYGKRYDADMIAVTGNAACSIALRNSVFKGIPKAFWKKAYDSARRIVAGDPKTVESRRKAQLDWLASKGIPLDRILATLEVGGVEDIGTEEMARIYAICQTAKDGEHTLESLFGMEAKDVVKSDKKGVAGLKETLSAKDGGSSAKAADTDGKDAAAITKPTESRMCEGQDCTREAEAVVNGHFFCPEHSPAGGLL